MPRQITDEEYSYLQSRRSVADFVESIYNDPALNREAKALIKKKYPNLQIHDFDLETKIEQKFADMDKARSDADEEKRRKAEDEKFAQARKATQEKYKLTDDAMKRLEDLMVERNIGDYEAAATYFVSKEPKPVDATYDHTRWHHERQPGFAEIAKDPEAWGRNEIMRALYADNERAKGGR